LSIHTFTISWTINIITTINSINTITINTNHSTSTIGIRLT
jgi:hypothetical protein